MSNASANQYLTLKPAPGQTPALAMSRNSQGTRSSAVLIQANCATRGCRMNIGRLFFILLAMAVVVQQSASVAEARGGHGSSGGYHSHTSYRTYTPRSAGGYHVRSSYRSYAPRISGGNHRSYRYTPRYSNAAHRYSRHSASSQRHFGVAGSHSSRLHARTSGSITGRTSNRRKRSASAKRAFEQQSGHPGGWRGHVVDHIVPLACGGADAPSNMQWQTIAEGKAKDKVERKGCGRKR